MLLVKLGPTLVDVGPFLAKLGHFGPDFEICPKLTNIDQLSTTFGRLGPSVGRNLVDAGEILPDLVHKLSIWA